MIVELRRLAARALCAGDFGEKGRCIDEMVALLDQVAELDDFAVMGDAAYDVEVVDPSAVRLPDDVVLVAPRELPRRTWGKQTGRTTTLHALAHIEANAVNLALDAVHRFGSMPIGYYRDWTVVAAEEHGHWVLLGERLGAFGARYGDFACHAGLWDIAAKTTQSVLERMALVPMVFEARGLDVTPGLIERFERHGDEASAEVLRIVLRDEIHHVEVGVKWFKFVCEGEGLNRWETFEQLVQKAGLMVVPPFNESARTESGFPADLLDSWTTSFVGKVP